jgi:hypothetical protein
MARLSFLLAFLACLSGVASEKPVQVAYSCSLADVQACSQERAKCIAFPRPWRRGYDAAHVCSCWAQSYLCYMDCNQRFPPDFQAECGKVCGKDTCQPAEGWAHP